MNKCGRCKLESKHHSGSFLRVFTRADGKCFMPPISVNQSKEYSQYLHFNITLDWKFNQTPSGYMDRCGWLKATTQLSNVCGASHVNNQILFFDGHYSHFGEFTLRQMKCIKIQQFVLKSGDSINYQNNDNGTNAKLKSLLNVAKDAWILKYGTTKFLPHQMNSILVES